jgi:hypothetical protein
MFSNLVFENRSKNGRDGGTGVYMWEGTTSRVTAADRPYGEFYNFYSVSPENFGSTLVAAVTLAIYELFDLALILRCDLEKVCFLSTEHFSVSLS